MNIVDEIGLDATLGQLAEEACELAQAALKMQRILMDKNPTPVTMTQAMSNLIEEATDVNLCLDVIEETGIELRDTKLYRDKLERWKNRIREVKEEE